MLSLHTLSLALLASIISTYAAVIDMEGLPETGLDTSSWVTGTAPPLENIWSANDMQIAAKNTLAPRWYGTFVLALVTEVLLLTVKSVLSYRFPRRGHLSQQSEHLARRAPQWV